MTSGVVVSDLHLFAQRAEARPSRGEIAAAASNAGFMVLNGDIFDFRWSTLRSAAASIDAAARWLEELLAGHAACTFHYVLGNHDSYEPFVDRLEQISGAHPNLHWHPSHVRLGASLFLHGDIPLHPRPADMDLHRVHPTLGRNGRTLRTAYRAFVAVRGHLPLAWVQRPRRCAERITRWMEQHPGELADGVEDVYFGHTHLAFTDFEHAGRRFHNTGASIRGLRGSILPVPAT